ncbi:cholinesterase [Rhodocollybia butyracea]|uniref:Carboxylic ester hydrolase n=1 Tax=Rhodocollybia butyracea TaxID=206335 RepID=A0A9P5U8T6_9AGAR|nr:cholinesterase [Rhodocollybia butyracea]
MVFSAVALASVLILSGQAIFVAALSSPRAVGSDLTLLFQNDLNWHTTADHTSTILISARTHKEAVTACSVLSEDLLSTTGEFFTSDIQNLIQFIELDDDTPVSQSFWVNAPSKSSAECTAISLKGISQVNCGQSLPAFCSNSAPNRISNNTDLGPQFQVQVKSGDLTFTGTRDHLSFRFLGIPYSNNPERFTYSSLFTGPPNDIDALTFGSPCAQVGGTGEENCLFLNIWTPFLPSEPTPKLKPVMFFIHGGAFTGGEGSDAIYDGGNSASRGDVVHVTINYRLGALGFMALDDGVTNGNYGIADQITALEWVRAHISAFGGDPSRVTILGQSAGAGSVRALLAAPPAFGLFAGAVAQSNLDGSSFFGFASTYSNYFTIEQSAQLVGSPTVKDVGCANGTAKEVLECLRAVPALTLQNLPTAPKFVVVDGKFIKTDQLVLNGSVPVAPAHVIFGWMADDGIDFQGNFPTSATTEAEDITTGIGISADIAKAVTASGLFPNPNTGNETLDIFNVTGRVSTDGQFRCLDQATIFAAAKHGIFKSLRAYQFDRSYDGFEPIPGLCSAPITPTHPFGDPNLPYFRCHSGDLFFTFGTLGESIPGTPFRDSNDLLFEQVIVDQWTSFARTFDPNPELAFLEARGYTTTTEALRAWGAWEEVGAANRNGTNVLRLLDVPSSNIEWLEQAQCDVLGFGLDFYG